VAEELGYAGSKLKIVGSEGTTVTTHGIDPVFSVEPFYFVQQLGPPQPWTGLGFVALLPAGAQLIEGNRDEEVGESKWWSPAELLRKLEAEKHLFMGFHYPVLLKVCRDLVNGTLQPKLTDN
jgi:hypothetical protein